MQNLCFSFLPGVQDVCNTQTEFIAAIRSYTMSLDTLKVPKKIITN